MERYFHHPESYCAFTSYENIVTPGMEEVSFEEFVNLTFYYQRQREMTLEAQIERLGNILERIASRFEGNAQDVPSPASDASVVSTVAADKPKRGRPAKIAADKPVETAAEPVVDVDDFLTEKQKTAEPEKVLKIEDVRAALVAFISKNGEPGRNLAKAIISKHGGGATRLEAAKETPNDLTGVLKAEFYAAVIKAANG